MDVWSSSDLLAGEKVDLTRDKLHVIERMRRPDLGHLEIEITLDDQGAFRKTWTGTKYATLAPDVELQEYVCNENNKDAAHLVGK